MHVLRFFRTHPSIAAVGSARARRCTRVSSLDQWPLSRPSPTLFPVLGIESLLQISQEQSAKQAGQHPYGQKETGAAGHPPTTIGCDSATRDDTMQVGMKEEILSSTVDHGEEADLGAQMLGIGSDGRQSLGRGSEQNTVDKICSGKQWRRSIRGG
jgi:hypothetical protein